MSNSVCLHPLGPWSCWDIDLWPCQPKIRAVSRTLFFYENLGSTARYFSQKYETLRCENSTLAIICLLLLNNGIHITILWAGLTKCSKDISCSQNLIAACDFYDARRTFYASSYENLIEKKCETHLSLSLSQNAQATKVWRKYINVYRRYRGNKRPKWYFGVFGHSHAVTLTYDLWTPKSNQSICPKMQYWQKFDENI